MTAATAGRRVATNETPKGIRAAMMQFRSLQQWFFPHAVFQDARDFFEQADTLAQGTFVVVLLHIEQVQSPEFTKIGWRIVDAAIYDDGHMHLMLVRDQSADTALRLPDAPDDAEIDALVIASAFHHQGRDMAEFAEYHEREHPSASLWLAWYGAPEQCPVDPGPRRRVVRFAPEAYSEGAAYRAMLVGIANEERVSHVAWLHFTARMPGAAIEKAATMLREVPNHSLALLRNGVADGRHNVLGRADAMAYCPPSTQWPTPNPAFVAADHLTRLCRRGLVPLVVFVAYDASDSTIPAFPASRALQRDRYVGRLHGVIQERDEAPSWTALACPGRAYPSSPAATSRVHLIVDVREGDAGIERFLSTAQATAADPASITAWLARDNGEAYQPPEWCQMRVECVQTKAHGTGPRLHAAIFKATQNDEVRAKDVVLFVPSEAVFETLGWDEIARRSLQREDEVGALLFIANDGEREGLRCVVWWLSGATALSLDLAVTPEWNEYQGEWLYTLAGLFSPPRAIYYEGVCIPVVGQAKREQQLVVLDKGSDAAHISSMIGIERATAQYKAMIDKPIALGTNLTSQRSARGKVAGARPIALRMEVNTTSGQIEPRIVFEE